ncbi:hypothetical protein [Oleiharenicola sp. Vm1]|uniref:hypothetical protein n=1 Tax=Oleiharenicola sp. Vm1 TaxID=3398393 RepID=UPI0039F5861F
MLCRGLALLLLTVALLARADDVGHEIARQHAQRAGGKYRELRSLYAEGRTLIGGEVIDVRMWAERPNRLRVESSFGARRVTQVYDGRHEPVIYHSEVEGGRPMRMTAGERKDFIANADFDGPLVDFGVKGYSVDYAGEDPIGGRPARKLLVMGADGEVFFVWLDVETAEMVKRSVFRMVGERRATVDTFFSDFRDVAGTLQPHRIETKVGDKTLYLMLLSAMEGNSEKVTAERFQVPADWPLLPVEFKSGAATPAVPAARR